MARSLFGEIAYQIFVAGNKKKTKRYHDKHDLTREQKNSKDRFNTSLQKVKNDLEIAKLRAEYLKHK